jgi:hypothetical protein
MDLFLGGGGRSKVVEVPCPDDGERGDVIGDHIVILGRILVVRRL